MQGLSFLYFLFGPTLGSTDKVTGTLELWLMPGIHFLLDIWYIYVKAVHDSRLDEWYFSAVAKAKIEGMEDEEEEEGLVDDLSINFTPGGEAMEF